MRALRLVSILVVILTAPASAQQIGLNDLVGMTINATTVRAQTVFDKGKEHSGTVRTAVEIVFGGVGDPVRSTYTSYWRGKNGHTSSWTRSGSGRLGKVKASPVSGGGHAVSFLENDTLHHMRTFKSGGFKIEIKFTRTPNGLACAFREAFLNEQGAKQKRSMSNATGRSILIVSDKQISSTCRVIKR